MKIMRGLISLVVNLHLVTLLSAQAVVHPSLQPSSNLPPAACKPECSPQQLCLSGRCVCPTGYRRPGRPGTCSDTLEDAFIIACSTLSSLPGQGIEVRLFDGAHLPRSVDASLDDLTTDVMKIDSASGWIYAVHQDNSISSSSYGEAKIYRFRIDTTPWQKELVFTESDLNSRISSIAISSENKVLYYATEDKTKIYAISTVNTMKRPKVVVVWKDLADVTSMDCSDKFLFFVNDGTIVRTTLDGDGRITMLDNNLDSIKSLKVHNNHVYFANGKRLERTNLYGEDRQVLVDHIMPSDFIVTPVPENQVFWLDSRRQSIMTYDEKSEKIHQFIQRKRTTLPPPALVLYSHRNIKTTLRSKKDDEICKKCGNTALCFPKHSGCKCGPGYTWNKSALKCENHVKNSIFVTKKRILTSYGKDVVNFNLEQNFSIYRIPVDLEYDIEIPVMSQLEGAGEAMAVSSKKVIYIAQFSSKYVGTINKIEHWEQHVPLADGNSRSNGVRITTLIDRDLGKVNGLALDEVNDLLYFTDQTRQCIEVISLKTLKRRVIVRAQVDRPHSIAVSPKQALIFWTDWKADGSAIVYRASSTGSNVEQLLFSESKEPTALSVNGERELLVWLDRVTQSIERMSIKGLQRKTIYKNKKSKQSDNVYKKQFLPYAMTWVDEPGQRSSLYYANQKSETVEKLQLKNGLLVKTQKKQSRPQGRFVSVQMRQIQAISSISSHTIVEREPNVCDHCTGKYDLCVPKQPHNYKCFCSTGLTANKTAGKCDDFPRKSIIYAVDKNIKRYSVFGDDEEWLLESNLAVSLFSQNRDLKLSSLKSLGIYRDHTLVICDMQDGIYSMDLKKQQPKLTRLFGDFEKPILDMAVDQYVGNVYWLSSYENRPSVYVGRLTAGKFHRLVDKGLDAAKSIAIDPMRGLLFWGGETFETPSPKPPTGKESKRQTRSSITRGYINKASITDIAGTTVRIWNEDKHTDDRRCIPGKMMVEGSKLYFACSRHGKDVNLGDLILSIGIIRGKVQTQVSIAGKVAGLAKVGPRLYWSDGEKYQVRSVIARTSNGMYSLDDEAERFESSGDRVTVAGMIGFDSTKKLAAAESKNPCIKNNGGCDGVCLLGNGEFVCYPEQGKTSITTSEQSEEEGGDMTLVKIIMISVIGLCLVGVFWVCCQYMRNKTSFLQVSEKDQAMDATSSEKIRGVQFKFRPSNAIHSQDGLDNAEEMLPLNDAASASGVYSNRGSNVLALRGTRNGPGSSHLHGSAAAIDSHHGSTINVYGGGKGRSIVINRGGGGGSSIHGGTLGSSVGAQRAYKLSTASTHHPRTLTPNGVQHKSSMPANSQYFTHGSHSGNLNNSNNNSLYSSRDRLGDTKIPVSPPSGLIDDRTSQVSVDTGSTRPTPHSRNRTPSPTPVRRPQKRVEAEV